MTWLHFATWLLIIYGTYYGAMISWDAIRTKKPAAERATQMLTFSEPVEVVTPLIHQEEEDQEPPVKATGGVNLRQLYALCRDETIEYRKAVSY